MNIKTLQEDIEKDTLMLKTKKDLLKALKTEEKRNRSFSETMIGKSIFKTICFATSGIANIHKDFDEAIRDPETAKAKKLAQKAEQLLAKAKKCNRELSERTASSVAVALAEHVMRIETHLTNNEQNTYLLISSYNKMKEEVERLRPPRDPQVEENIKRQLEAVLGHVPM